MLDCDGRIDKGRVVHDSLRKVHPRSERIPSIHGANIFETRTVKLRCACVFCLEEFPHPRIDLIIDLVPLQSDRYVVVA